MTLAAGARLGPYEILAPLGAGGMGEVYRARDARLGREVAIKVLPSGLSQDRERLGRFEQEARAASALNHPNIVTVHDIGRSDGVFYVAMELVEGKTLRELSAAGALPARRILSLAPQIADGLAKAHAAGIIHRDLKPENLMVSKDGFVKILDFGLAKLVLPESGEVSAMPTVDKPETQPGVVMGTLAYMSPEQASGQALDFRTDQFSLGSILYELATGQRPFQGKTGPETLAAIIRQEPKAIGELAPATPPPLRWIVERCLAKEPVDRYASTRDLARELASLRDHLSEVVSGEGALPGPRPKRLRSRETASWALAAALAAALALTLFLRRAAPPTRLYTSINPPAGTDFSWDYVPPELSPDGRRMVFGAQSGEGSGSLWLRAFAEKEAQQLPGTEHAINPFWSPDSRTIGFFTWPEGKLKRVGISGGSLQVLCDAPEGRGGTWGADGVILLGTLNGPVYRVSAAGGTPSAVTRLNASRQEVDHRWPHFLHLWLSDLARGTSSRLTFDPADDESPVWSPDGRQIAFSSNRRGPQTLYVKAANGAEPEEPLLEPDREKSPEDWSPDGRFILFSYRQIDGHNDLWALPMAGERKPFPVVQTPFNKNGSKFSPDGRSIAYVSEETGRSEVYVQAFPRAGERLQVSTGGGSLARWRHDGNELFYVAADGRMMAVGIQARPELSASVPRNLFQSPVPGAFQIFDVSRDGQRFLFVVPDREAPRLPITVIFNWSPEGKR